MYLCESFGKVRAQGYNTYTRKHEYTQTFPTCVHISIVEECISVCMCIHICVHALHMSFVCMNIHVILNVKFLGTTYLLDWKLCVQLREKSSKWRRALAGCKLCAPLTASFCIPYFSALYITWCCQDCLKNSCCRSLPASMKNSYPALAKTKFQQRCCYVLMCTCLSVVFP